MSREAPSSLFFALRPDEQAAAQIHRLALRLRELSGLRGAPLPVERLHVTLLFLGNYPGLPGELIDAADTAARAVRAAPFDLPFDRVMSFARSDGAAPLVLCRGECPSLSALRNALALEIARTGLFPREARSFRPHITLLYDRKMISEQQVAPISWTVREMLLIRSLVGLSRHEVLARYALGRDTP